MSARIALITGCSTGIGLATAVRLAQDPDRSFLVYATMRNLDKRGKLEKAAGSALNDTLFIRELDITKEDQIVSNVKEIVDKHGRIDILMNNGAFGYAGPLEDMTISYIRKITETNIIGTIRMTQEVIPFMKRQRSGRIINISSLAGFTSFPFGVVYSASKFAVEGFTEGLYPELRCFDVWISSICPGPVKTNFTRNMYENKDSDMPSGIVSDPDSPTGKLFYHTMRHMSELIPKSSIQRSHQIVDVIVTCLNDPKPRLRYGTSEHVEQKLKLKFADGIGASEVEECFEIIAPKSKI